MNPKIIWKFELTVAGRQTIPMPIGAQILTAQMQFDKLCLWALVDPDANNENRSFAIYGTGHKISTQAGRYITTFQLQGGSLIFHIFEMETT